MKKILFIIMICVISQITKAQSSDIGKISLAIVMPENIDDLNAAALSRLESKITNIVTNSGIAAGGGNNSFVIYPKFAVYETNVVEGGMQNIIVVKSELSLFIKQVDNNLIFSSISKTINGSGNTKSVALSNAISKIDVRDIDYYTFVESAKSKIINYYESKCSNIIVQAENFEKKQSYNQAFALLMSVPEDVSCYNKVQEKAVDVYIAYQNQQCKTLIHQVNLAVTNNDYNKALEILAYIDPSSSCSGEAQEIIKKIKSKIDAQQKKQLELYLKVYEDQLVLKKQRINAVKDIAVAYYKNQPSIRYSLIFR